MRERLVSYGLRKKAYLTPNERFNQDVKRATRKPESGRAR